jgi:hypothetical protein
MKKIVFVALALVSSLAWAQTTPVPVTADNFRRAETDWYFGMFAERGAFGKFFPYRELPVDGVLDLERIPSPTLTDTLAALRDLAWRRARARRLGSRSES